jgi:serine/threonine protein kinase
MEFIEGQTLKEMLAAAPDGCLPEEQVLDWARQICDVLDYLHRHEPPVIFRDLKPANVMITPQGQVKLIDFGVARLFDPAKGTDTLKMGTVGYAPPEQYAGQGQTTPRSDVYALGATLYELLTGDNPEAHPFVFSTVRRLKRGVSPRTAQAIARAVQLDPNARFPSVRAMKAALQKPRRRPLAALAVTLPLALLLAGGGWWAWHSISQGTPAPSPTSSGLAVVQATPSPTPTRRPTVTLAPTHTPSPVPTEPPTPKPTASSTPTPMPTRTPAPTQSGSPTLTSVPTAPPASGALITFEQFGSWRRGDQPHGELTQTQEQVHSGSYAAKLRYNFPAGGDDFVVFIHPLSLAGNPNTIGAWVYGDGSAHFLNIWIEDAQGEIWSVALGKVGTPGWRQMVGVIDANLPWPSGHISGPDNRTVD